MNGPTSNPFNIRKVIAASSVGTMIEWYDFYIFGMLSTTISTQFFPKENPTAALLSTLAIFAAGFIVRPFGALVFGRLGDLIGRKYTFLLTLILMGGSTFLIGCVPSYDSIGIAAPIIVLLLRLLQGLALGGEYGGAAIYVAEHAPVNKRGYYTSWIQTTATLGLFIALGVILLVKSNMSDAAFNAHWGGWRYPFWISILLVGISIYIRLKMKESPMFSKLKAEGKTSVNPLKESFRHKTNFKMVLLALFGAVMGQGVIWYTGQFYAQNFLETKCFIEFEQSRTILLWAIAFATPLFIFWGWLSDKIGRKWIMMAGMLLAIMTYRPIFNTFLQHTSSEEWQKLAANDFKDYKLKITGLVDNPVELSLQELKNLGMKQTITMHHCIQGRSGVAEWGGLPIGKIIELVKPHATVATVAFYSFGEGIYGGYYYDTITLDNCLKPQSILAWEMNYETLPLEHGAPLRLRVENQLGYKMVKWISSIEFLETHKTIGKGFGGKNEDDEYFDLLANT